MDLHICIDVEIIVEDLGRGHEDSSQGLIELACADNLLSHVDAVPQKLYFGELLCIPKPNLTGLTD